MLTADILVVNGALTGSPNPITRGGQLTVSYSVRNAGNVNAGASTTHVQLKDQSNGTWEDWYCPISGVNVGQTINVNNVVTVNNGEPAGTYKLVLVLDAFNVVPQGGATQNDFSGIYNLTVSVPGVPNLTPSQPSGWSDKIVASTVTGTNTDSSPIYNDQNIYVDWAVINSGSGNAASAFNTYLYVDGGFKQAWSTSSLSAGGLTSVSDYLLGTLSAGTHQLKIVTDVNGNISESNEGDNEYTKTITVGTRPLPNLTLYTPSGWSDKVVASTVTGTNTDSSPIYSNQNIYVDFAITNNGTASINGTFLTRLYVDGAPQNVWFTNSLNAGASTSVVDYNIGALSAGAHTITVVTDSDGYIAESSEADNGYPKTITVVPLSIPPAPSAISPGSGTSPGQTIANSTPTLSWTAMTGVDNFGVYISRQQLNGTYALVFDSLALGINISGGATSYQIPPGYLQDGGQYRWNMNAHNSLGWGTYSSLLYLRYSTASVPSAPSGLLATATGSSSIQLNWNTTSGATGYKVFRALSSSGPWTLMIAISTDNQLLDTGLQPDTVYYYEVSASNHAGDSLLSSSGSARTSVLNQPAAPSGVTTQVKPDDSVVVTWTAVAGTKYTIQRSVYVDHGFSTIGGVGTGASSFIDMPPTPIPSITYFYRVIAEVGVVQSNPSVAAMASVTHTAEQIPPASNSTKSISLPTQTGVRLYDYKWHLTDPNQGNWTWIPITDLGQLTVDDPNFWAEQTIMLTHGWDAKFIPDNNPATMDWINKFALVFAHNHSEQAFNILAVDWHGAGSDPNGVSNPLLDFADTGLNDAIQSSTNAINVGDYLASKFELANINPKKFCLIGHSNGAGLMAEMAIHLKAHTLQNVRELDALDAPAQTKSYWKVWAATSAVDFIDNYYLPVAQTDLLVIANFGVPSLVPTLGFGLPILDAENVRNFELNWHFTDWTGHQELPSRFAQTAGDASSFAMGSPWGLYTSRFLGSTGQFGSGIYVETVLGYFEQRSLTETALTTFVQGLEALGGGFTVTLASDVIVAGEVVAGTATTVVQFGVNAEMYIGQKVVDLTLATTHFVVAVSRELWSDAVALTKDAINGVHTLLEKAQSLGGSIFHWIHGWIAGTLSPAVGAPSPSSPVQDIQASVDVHIPEHATTLEFNLTVNNPGNDDLLTVLIGNTVIGQVDLATQQISGGGVQLWVQDYADQVVTLTFAVPTAASTTDFVIGNLNFATTAAVYTLTGVPGAQTLTLNSGSLAFSEDLAATYPNLTLALMPNTSVVFNSSQHLAALSLSGGAVSLAPGGNKALVTNSLSISNGGKLDLADNALIVDYVGASNLSAVKNYILTGRGGTDFGMASWNGPGINSSVAAAQDGFSFAIGYVENSFLPNLGVASYSAFMGQTIDGTSILVRYTRGADATLDGVVNSDEVTIMGLNYNSVGTGDWFLGDFDYDGKCDSDDVTSLGLLYNPTAPPLSPAFSNVLISATASAESHDPPLDSVGASILTPPADVLA